MKKTATAGLCTALMVVVGARVLGEESTEKVNLARFDAAIKDGDREHWSFQPLKRPPLPSVGDANWVRNPIDAFALAGLEANNMHPAAPAPCPTVRRAPCSRSSRRDCR